MWSFGTAPEAVAEAKAAPAGNRNREAAVADSASSNQAGQMELLLRNLLSKDDNGFALREVTLLPTEASTHGPRVETHPDCQGSHW